jgi:hypothetical protein
MCIQPDFQPETIDTLQRKHIRLETSSLSQQGLVGAFEELVKAMASHRRSDVEKHTPNVLLQPEEMAALHIIAEASREIVAE